MSEPAGTTVPLTEQDSGQTDPAYQGPQDSTEPGTTAAQPQASDNVERIGELSTQRLTDLKAAQGPLQPTAIDASGVERIVGPAVDDNWSPAPVEPDPEEIARLEVVKQKADERRAERLAATQAAPSNLGNGPEVTKAAFASERGESAGES